MFLLIIYQYILENKFLLPDSFWYSIDLIPLVHEKAFREPLVAVFLHGTQAQVQMYNMEHYVAVHILPR